MFARTQTSQRSWSEQARALLPYLTIVAIGVAVGLWASSDTSDWRISNWIELIYGAFVALALTYIGRHQQRVQQAVSDLQLREKVGVIEASALRSSLGTGAGDPLWCLYVASDVRAALHLFPLARPTQQIDLLISVSRAFEAMIAGNVAKDLSLAALDCLREGVRALDVEMQAVVRPDNREAQQAFDRVTQFRKLLEQYRDNLARSARP